MDSRFFQLAIPAALVGAMLCAVAWLLAGWGGVEAAPGKAAAHPPIATRYDRVFHNIYYRVPVGYRAIQQQNGVVMVRQSDLASGELRGVLMLTPGFPLDAKTQAKFKASGRKIAIQSIAVVAGNLAEDPDAKLTDPQAANDSVKDGYESYSVISKSHDKEAGKIRFTQYVIVLSRDHVDIVMRVAYGSEANYEALTAGFNALLTSIEPKNSGAPAPTRLAAALPTDMAAITPKPRAAPAQTADVRGNTAKSSGGGGRSCRIVQRQMCSGGFASGMGYFCNTYPQSVCD